uniref:MATH domain-containing protein n=1 Tax=Strigamia maritima TaxID=126957 RepID=T1J0A7_STRMM
MLTCNSCNLALASERYIEGSCGDIFCNKCIYINNNLTAFCPLHYIKISIVIFNMEATEDSASFEDYTDSSSDKFSRTLQNCKEMFPSKENEDIRYSEDCWIGYQTLQKTYEFTAMKQRLTKLEMMLGDMQTVSNRRSPRSIGDNSRKFENEKNPNEISRNLCQCKFAPFGCIFQGYRTDVLKHEQDYASHQILLMNAILQQNHAIEDLKTDNRMLKNAFNHCSDLIQSKGSSNCSEANILNSTVELDAKSIEEVDDSPLEKFKDRNFYKLIEFVESEEQRNSELNEFRERLEYLESLEGKLKINNDLHTTNFDEHRERLDKIAKELLGINNKFVEYFERFAELEKALASQKVTSEEKWYELNLLEKYVDDLSQTTESVQKKQQDHEDKLLSLTLSKVKLNEVLEKQENKINDFAGKLTAKSSILNSHSCTYVWKIENFSQQQEKVKSGENSHGYVCSYPFYTSEYGYKMTLNIDPNGFGSGNGTHLSCFLHIMKSSMDAILKWPVEYSARFTLMDQLNTKSHHSSELYVSFLHHNYKDAVSRPLNDENPGCGIHQFIALNRLKPLYLVDDTLFLMVEVKIKM